MSATLEKLEAEFSDAHNAPYHHSHGNFFYILLCPPVFFFVTVLSITAVTGDGRFAVGVGLLLAFPDIIIYWAYGKWRKNEEIKDRLKITEPISEQIEKEKKGLHRNLWVKTLRIN
jgi:hypothetical protein